MDGSVSLEQKRNTQVEVTPSSEGQSEGRSNSKFKKTIGRAAMVFGLSSGAFSVVTAVEAVTDGSEAAYAGCYVDDGGGMEVWDPNCGSGGGSPEPVPPTPPAPTPTSPPSGGGGGGSGGSSGGSGGSSSNGGSSSSGGEVAQATPRLSFSEMLNRDFNEVCAYEGFSWVAQSPLFIRPSEATAGFQTEDNPAILAPMEVALSFGQQLAGSAENPDIVPEDPYNPNDRHSGRLEELVQQCELDFVTRTEFAEAFGEAAVVDYDQFLIDFGRPVTNWEVIVAMKEKYNVTPNYADQETLFVFVGARWQDAITNNPELTPQNFADGSKQIADLPEVA